METLRTCKSCKKKSVIRDELGNCVCESCGVVQEFDNFQANFGGINGPQGTFVRIGSSANANSQNLYTRNDDFSYRESKIYHAGKRIEEISSNLGFSSMRTSEVKRMIEEITEGEFGMGNWFTVLIGACCYLVMRMNNMPIPMSQVVAEIGYDVHELGRMIIRVVDFLNMENLPEFDIVLSLERAFRDCSCFGGISNEEMDRMVKQGRFILQCAVKWYLTTGRQPIPVVVAVLVFIAELNEVKVSIGDVAKELNAGVGTSKRRFKELKQALVKVAQEVLPWGEDVTVKNVEKHAPCVIQYMEMKSMLKPGSKRKESESFGLDLEELVNGCLQKEVQYTTDDCGTEENGPQYLEYGDGNQMSGEDIGDLENFQISEDCLSRIYEKFSNAKAFVKSMVERGEDHRRKRKKGNAHKVDKEWWDGKSDMSRKLSFKELLEKDVGYNPMPPSFVAGELACKRRREKIHAAKLRINEIIQPQNNVSGDKDNEKFQKTKGCDMDWEDFIIETLLLRQVREDEIVQGHYKRLLSLYASDSEYCNNFGHQRRSEYKPNQFQ